MNTTGPIINTATVSGENHDYNLVNNKASKTIDVAKAADLKISKSVNNTAPDFGNLVKWTLTVRNDGPDAASGVNVSDVLPAGLIYQSSSASVGNYVNGKWSVGNLAKGASATLNIVCRINKTGSIMNVASVTGNEYDINKNNNRAESLINIPKASDLAITKKSNVTSPNYGDLVRWTLTIKNNGPDNATEVTVDDIIPQGLVFKSSSGDYVNGRWSVGNLNVGQSDGYIRIAQYFNLYFPGDADVEHLFISLFVICFLSEESEFKNYQMAKEMPKQLVKVKKK